jgi:hypothetical protein
MQFTKTINNVDKKHCLEVIKKIKEPSFSTKEYLQNILDRQEGIIKEKDFAEPNRNLYFAINFIATGHYFDSCLQENLIFANDFNLSTQRTGIIFAQAAQKKLFDLFAPLKKWNINWRTSNTVGIAQSMYATDDYSSYGILKDALMDAGCEEPDVFWVLENRYLCKGTWLLEQLQ